MAGLGARQNPVGPVASTFLYRDVFYVFFAMVDDYIKRKIMRLDRFDYSQAGPHFLTLCVYNRQNLFGSITSQGDLVLTTAGKMVKRIWLGLPEFIHGLIIDEYIVMPNHFHAIIGFVSPGIMEPPRPFKTETLTSEDWRALRPATTDTEVDQSSKVESKMLQVSDIVKRFKNQTLREYRRGVEAEGWMQYRNRLWQRGFWDRIIRNEKDLQAHREYIYNNVKKWHLDQVNADNL